MKTYIRRQQHKNFKHQDIKQKKTPQKYRLGTISNTKLLAGLNRFYTAVTSPSYFLFVAYLSKQQNILKTTQLTATSLDLLRCSRSAHKRKLAHAIYSDF